MTKKQKAIINILFIIILIAITRFLIITYRQGNFGGCYGPEPVIDSNDTNLKCFTAETNSCIGTIELENNCNQTLNYYHGGSCSIKDSSSRSNKEIMPEAKVLSHSDFIEIPTNWILQFYQNEVTYFCKKDFFKDKPKLYVHKCVEISCIKDNPKSNIFSLELGAALKKYTIKGHYEPEKAEKKSLDLPHIILLLSIFLFLFFSAVLFVRKKHKIKA